MTFRSAFVVSTLCGLALSTTAHATVIFSENFDAATPGPTLSGAITNTVVSSIPGSNVDIVGNVNGSYFTCSSGLTTNCVDLIGGLQNPPSGIQSNAMFNLVAGNTYKLTFDSSGSGSHSGFTWNGRVDLGSNSFLFSAVGGASSDAVTNQVWNITAAATENNVRLVFTDLTAPDSFNGIELDNIVLQTTAVTGTPEPASFVYFSLGLVALVFRSIRANR